MPEKIVALQPIKAYEPPSWLVEIVGRPVTGNLVAAYLAGAEVTILERGVLGWGGANTIIRLQRDDPYEGRAGDFLAIVEEV